MGLGTVALLSMGDAGLAQTQEAAENPSSLASGWQRIVAFFAEENEDRRRSNNNGSRPGNGVCLISPPHQQVLWHREPLMLWQSTETHIGIRPQGAEDRVLWRATATASEVGVDTYQDIYQASYAGVPLEPEETYEWLFYINPERPSFWFRFELMGAMDYAQHAVELGALLAPLAAAEAGAEEIALAKAGYFLDNNLPADALQVVFAVSDPSSELLEAQAALVAEICGNET